MADRAAKPSRIGTGLVLLAGFGGVLALMATAGIDAIGELARIEATNKQITQSFLKRNRALERMRSSLYLSGTYVRDYLLDPDPGSAQVHRQHIQELRADIERELRSYSEDSSAQEKASLAALKTSLSRYWEIVDPVLRWNVEERRQRGYPFVTHEVFPYRMQILRITDAIGDVNEGQLRAGEARAADLLAGFRRRLGVMMALTLGLGLLLAAVSTHHILRLEKEARLRYQEIVRAQKELQDLSARLVEAQEQERRSISRELHDEIGQSLTALLVDLGNAAASAPPDAEELHRHLASVKALAENSVNAVRNMALLLRPSMLDDFGLVPALHWQAREISRRTGLRVEVDADEVSDDLLEEQKTCVYRLVQEALHNCSRHAEARSVKISAHQNSEKLLLTIQDDGKGFDSQNVRGLGLLGMEERVKHLGGVFQLESHLGWGTRLKIELPLEGHSENHSHSAGR